ncbi:Transposon TX1 uncharacterized protein, partial [Tetrabaena socialis]
MGSRSVSLVDRAYSPAAYTANPHARLVGVGAACMPAPPALGGFGLLPLVEHVRGRHAALAARCLVGACPGLGAVQLPWALVALALLQHLHPAASPLCLLTARVTPARGLHPAAVLVLGRPVPASCPALVQLASAFFALPPPVIITPPEPGPWCFNAPLWGNPFLPGPAPGRSLDTDFADLANVPGLCTVGMAVSCCLAMEVIPLAVPPAPPGRPLNPAATARRMTAAYHAVVLGGILRCEPAALPLPLRSYTTARARLLALYPWIPPDWRAAVGAVLQEPGGAAAAPAAPIGWALLARHLGWRVGAAVYPLWSLTVTILKLQPTLQALHAHHRPFVGEAAVMPRRYSNPRRAPPALRVGSHNVRGLLGTAAYGGHGRLVTLLHCWAQQHLDVVCVQETHVCSRDIPRASTALLNASRELRLGVWRMWWAPAPSPRAGGVAIFFRSALCTSGAFQLRADPPAPAAATEGRLLHLPVAWGGHDFTLACAYLPSGNPPAQRAFIKTHLAPLAAAPGSHVWAADFNFVTHPALDGTSARIQDAATARCFLEACPGLADAFRCLHPARRAFSFVHPAGASRLDRILVSAALLPSTLSCSIAAGHPSDHRLVCVAMAASPAASPPGPGLRRVRLHFRDFPDLREELRTWVEAAAVAAPTTPAALLAWWPAFKRSLSISACNLSRVARERHLDAKAAEWLPRKKPMQHLPRARSAAASAALRAAVGPACRTRHAWLRTGERPSPIITQQVRPPAACRLIPALRRPDGTATANPDEMPGVMAAFWQRICTAAATDPEARERLASAFSALPPPVIITPPEPGPWCFNAPLWGNPFLPGPAPGRSLDTDFADLAGVPGLCTVGMAVCCCLAMEVIPLAVPPAPPGRPLNPAATARHMTAAYHAVVLRGILRCEPAALPLPLRSYTTARARLLALYPWIPPDWRAAVGAVLHEPGGAAAAPAAPIGWALLARHLGWRVGAAVYPLRPLPSSSNRPVKPCKRITGHSIIRVSAETVADFWARLREFAAMGLPPC